MLNQSDSLAMRLLMSLSQILKRALADIGYIQTAGKAMRDLLIPAYVKAFHSVNGEQIQLIQTSLATLY